MSACWHWTTPLCSISKTQILLEIDLKSLDWLQVSQVTIKSAKLLLESKSLKHRVALSDNEYWVTEGKENAHTQTQDLCVTCPYLRNIIGPHSNSCNQNKDLPWFWLESDLNLTWKVDFQISFLNSTFQVKFKSLSCQNQGKSLSWLQLGWLDRDLTHLEPNKWFQVNFK